MMSFEMCKVSASVNMKILSLARLIGSAHSARENGMKEDNISPSCVRRTIRAKGEHCNPVRGSRRFVPRERNLFGTTVCFSIGAASVPEIPPIPSCAERIARAQYYIALAHVARRRGDDCF